MHAEAMAYTREALLQYKPELVLEFGSLNINGSAREIIPELAKLSGTAEGDIYWMGVDLQYGPGVEVVADAATFTAPFRVAAVVCNEVLEHTPEGEAIVANAALNLHHDGVLILTCATDPRAPHSAVDGGPLREGEHYENIEPNDLVVWCELAGLSVVSLEASDVRGDLYMTAVRR